MRSPVSKVPSGSNSLSSLQVRLEKDLLREERLRHKQKKESLRSFKTEALKPRGLKEKMLRRKSKMQQQQQQQQQVEQQQQQQQQQQ